MSTGLAIFTLVHVVLSLVGIASGFVVLFGLFPGKRLDGWTALFLGTTVATSATGFLFRVQHFMPSHAVGIVSLVALAVAMVARYQRHLVGILRPTYVASAVLALYLNVFVLIVQLFLKVPALHALAPAQTESPFLIAQFVVLVAFIVFGIWAAIRFRDEPVAATIGR